MSPDQILRAALDEPAPPPPADPVEDDDDGHGDGHHHIHLHVVPPVVIVLADGSIRTDGWAGTALVASYALAAFVTVWLAVEVIWAHLSPIVATVALLWLSVFGAVMLVLAVYIAIRAGWRRWRARRSA